MINKKYLSIVLLTMTFFSTGYSTVHAAPDLIISQFDHPLEVAIGEPFVATVTVANQGVDNISVGDTAYYSVFLSTDGALDNNDICAGYGSIPHPYATLTSGTSYVDSIRLQLNAQNTNAGVYYLIARIDSLCSIERERIVESDETNNDFIGTLVSVNDSTAEIDLTISDVIGDSTVLKGQSLRVDVYLENIGPDTAPGLSATACGYYTEVFLSTDTTITTSDISLGRTCHASLAGYSTNRFFKDVVVPENIPGGFYYWGAITDSTEILVETDETNNAATGNKVGVRGRPQRSQR